MRYSFNFLSSPKLQLVDIDGDAPSCFIHKNLGTCYKTDINIIMNIHQKTPTMERRWWILHDNSVNLKYIVNISFRGFREHTVAHNKLTRARVCAYNANASYKAVWTYHSLQCASYIVRKSEYEDNGRNYTFINCIRITQWKFAWYHITKASFNFRLRH